MNFDLTKVCRKKLIGYSLLIALILFLLVYIIYGLYIGQITKDIVLSAFEKYNYVENNPYNNIISDEDYNLLVIKKMANYNITNSYDKIHLTCPFVLHWFTGAKVWISYDYSFYIGQENMIYLTNVLVEFTYELQNGNWYVTDFHSYPSSTGA